MSAFVEWRNLRQTGRQSTHDFVRPTFETDDLDDIEELRAAYRAVVESTPISEAPDGNTLHPVLIRLLNRPRLVVGTCIGICVLASAVYCALGYWWMTSVNATPTPEAVSMMSIHEIDQLRGETSEALKNIQKVEQALDTGGMNGKPMDISLDEPMTMLSVNVDGGELTGRSDPFAPLVYPSGHHPVSYSGDKAPDILENVQFTGFIGDVGSKDKVAIIRINDPAGNNPTSLVKKAGQSFSVDGEKVLVNAITKDTVVLKVRGATRRLTLRAYQDISMQNNASIGASGSTSSVNSTNGSTITSVAKLDNIQKIADSAADGNGETNPKLMEE